MTLAGVREGVGIAVDSLLANKVRASLTILGIVIGVATVMTISALIVGIRSTVTSELSALGPNNFTIERYDQTQISLVNIGDDRAPWRGKPRITLAEADLVATLPSIQSVTANVSTSASMRVGTSERTGVSVRGQGHLWTDYTRGEFISGRNFLPSEDARAASVAVLSETAATGMFGEVDPVGVQIRLGLEQFLVIGVYREVPNVLTGGSALWVTVPTSTAIRRLRANADWLTLQVVPAQGYTQAQAMDQVTAALRSARRLAPAEDNNFALVRQEAFTEMFDRLTWVFFLVLLILSSIGLVVGGVGVVGIMMISVTERTREIGVRKALGATRTEILWQFLVESVTVTVIGGAIGILAGAGIAVVVESFTPLPASVPLWSVLAALGVSAIAGIGFGLYPANQAARLDPVEALRYE